jgi:RNA polymerase sigma-70 factor, ECF subfamily
VFVKVRRALEGFKGDSKFSTWIYRIATNAALDKLRSSSFQRTAECVPLTEEVELQELASLEKVAAAEQEESSLEWEVFQRERLECYCDVLKDLPANYRAVVALSELGDLAADEIAKILGLSAGTVKIRLHRGRERLLRELKAHCRAEDWL